MAACSFTQTGLPWLGLDALTNQRLTLVTLLVVLLRFQTFKMLNLSAPNSDVKPPFQATLRHLHCCGDGSQAKVYGLPASEWMMRPV